MLLSTKGKNWLVNKLLSVFVCISKKLSKVYFFRNFHWAMNEANSVCVSF